MNGLYGPQEYPPEFGPYGNLDGPNYVHEYPPEFGPYVTSPDHNLRQAEAAYAYMDASPQETSVSNAPIEALEVYIPTELDPLSSLNNPLMAEFDAAIERHPDYPGERPSDYLRIPMDKSPEERQAVREEREEERQAWRKAMVKISLELSNSPDSYDETVRRAWADRGIDYESPGTEIDTTLEGRKLSPYPVPIFSC